MGQECPNTNWRVRLVLEPDGWMTWRDVSKDSCPVTVGVDVTGIDVSITVTMTDKCDAAPTGSRNLNGDLTLGTRSRSFFS